MIHLKINKQMVRIESGCTILEAAKKADVNIPTLCHLEKSDHFTSCMVCLVKENQSNKFLPACSALAIEGMEIETESEDVLEMRRNSLELLLSEHLGDCEGPCSRICPAHMNIPLMIRQIQKGQFREALITVKREIALPAVLGRICPAPCEKGCSRNQIDASVGICLLKRFVADLDLESEKSYIPSIKKSSGKKVAIVGTGPAGLAAGYHLLEEGISCTFFEKEEMAGGMLRYGVDEKLLPREIIEKEIGIIQQMGGIFQKKTFVDEDFLYDRLMKDFDAVIVGTGQDENEFESFGLKTAKDGIIINPKTHETSVKGIFAGGNVVRKGRLAIRSVAHGKNMALSVVQYLNHGKVIGLRNRFDSKVGRFSRQDALNCLEEASERKRITPSQRESGGYTKEEAVRESERCLHCDCRKPNTCRLRHYADHFQVQGRLYKSSERKTVIRNFQHDEVIYEPGKCIKCSICVRITANAKEDLGLTFIGRGFDVQVGIPFNESLENGLKKVAKQCVESCPTGALAFRNGEEVM